MRILLIDDDLPSITNLKDALEPGGHECVLFQNPLAGLAAFQNDHFDLVVTDYKMAEIDGIEVLHSIHEMDPSAYVILLTGYADVENAIAAVNDNAYAFFRKPLDLGKFMNTISIIEKELRASDELADLYNQILFKLSRIVKSVRISKKTIKKNEFSII